MRRLDVVIVFLLLVAIAVVVSLNWNLVSIPTEAVFNARAQLTLVGVTSGAAVVALWYAYLTRQLAAAAQRQLAQAGKEYLERNKPVVFIDRWEHPEQPGNFHYVMRNVGGGFAVNVYYFGYDNLLAVPTSLGSLPSGHERRLPDSVNQLLIDGHGGLKHLLVAEGPYSRTTQWTASINLRSQSAGQHHGQVLHALARPASEPPRWKHQNLVDYMNGNRAAFHGQLTALQEEDR